MEVLGLFFSFTGRINRAAFWTAYVAVLVYGALTLTIARLASGVSASAPGVGANPPAPAGQALLILLGALIALLLFFWIDLAIRVKRWHDRGKSGWWVLLAFVPLIGPIWTLVECGCLPGSPGDNRHGPSTRPTVDVAEAFT